MSVDRLDGEAVPLQVEECQQLTIDFDRAASIDRCLTIDYSIDLVLTNERLWLGQTLCYRKRHCLNLS
jgi:hypothetical protein